MLKSMQNMIEMYLIWGHQLYQKSFEKKKTLLYEEKWRHIMVCIADFVTLKIKQETIRKCHTCCELHQAAPLNFSGDMHLCLSATRALLVKKVCGTLLTLLGHLRTFFKSHPAFKHYLCAFALSVQSFITQCSAQLL